MMLSAKVRNISKTTKYFVLLYKIYIVIKGVIVKNVKKFGSQKFFSYFCSKQMRYLDYCMMHTDCTGRIQINL